MTNGIDQKSVSIIVPLYRGAGYVGRILKQIEKNVSCTVNVKVEVILYNDYPQETISIDKEQYGFEIKLINAEQNMGIHGARVTALELAEGDYILFLDQDDVIREHYIEEQCHKIGDADAIVCRLINGKRLHYTHSFPFENVITKEFMLHKWCPIVSPGQVLIKRESIPDIWKKHILTNNGADDYFLWLCMMAEGKKFALNQSILFEHVITGKNTSENTNMMMDSEEEMLRILETESVFAGEENSVLSELRLSLRRIHVKQLDTQRRALNCLNRIYLSFISKEHVYDWLNRYSDKKIAIYGAGELGLGLYDFLTGQGLAPVCYLDQNAEYILLDISSYTMEQAEMKLDSILLTISDRKLKEKLEEKFQCEVIDVGEW